MFFSLSCSIIQRAGSYETLQKDPAVPWDDGHLTESFPGGKLNSYTECPTTLLSHCLVLSIKQLKLCVITTSEEGYHKKKIENINNSFWRFRMKIEFFQHNMCSVHWKSKKQTTVSNQHRQINIVFHLSGMIISGTYFQSQSLCFNIKSEDNHTMVKVQLVKISVFEVCSTLWPICYTISEMCSSFKP